MKEKDSVFQRHTAFWKLENETALVGRVPFTGWDHKPFPTRQGYITDTKRVYADDLHPQLYVGEGHPLPIWPDDDFIPFLSCVYSQAWMEAVSGCQIFASDVSLTAKPAEPPDWNFSHRTALESPFAAVFDETQRAAVRLGNGVIPAAQLHIRGVADIASAYFGETTLCMELYDDPSRMQKLFGEFAQTILQFSQRSLRLRGTFHGGYVSNWNVFCPEPLLDYQIDASAIFSKEMYAEFFLPFDEYILGQFPAQVVHMHSCALRHSESVANIKALRCVEISLDRETSDYDFDRLRRSVELFQESGKCVILHGELAPEELEQYLRLFSPKGLAIWYWEPLA